VADAARRGSAAGTSHIVILCSFSMCVACSATTLRVPAPELPPRPAGTKAFSEMIKAKGQKMSDDEQSNLIGQFGVGFYSGFLVADKITVYSKGWNDPAGKTHVWQSEAGSSYTIAEVTGDEAIQAGSGTRLELSLREDAEDYLEDLKV
jgi:HSP90 family molecular chaperone